MVFSEMTDKIKSKDVHHSKRSSKGKLSRSPVTKSSADDGGDAHNNTWDCTVCTYKNPAEAFKCLMCDVRKGTSTRKPRINPELVAQQVARQQQHLLQKISSQNLPKSPVKSSKNSIDSSPASPGPSHSNSSSTNNSRDSHIKEKDNQCKEKDTSVKEKDRESQKNYNNLTKSNLNNNNHGGKTKTSSNDDCDCSQQAVTVNNVTVWIKEFLRYTKSPPRSPQESDNVVP